jgi:hypothetical protein
MRRFTRLIVKPMPRPKREAAQGTAHRGRNPPTTLHTGEHGHQDAKEEPVRQPLHPPGVHRQPQSHPGSPTSSALSASANGATPGWRFVQLIEAAGSGATGPAAQAPFLRRIPLPRPVAGRLVCVPYDGRPACVLH